LNSSFLRFADEENMWMLIFSLATCYVIQSTKVGNLTALLISYWILISPLPRALFLKEVIAFKRIPTFQPLAPVNIRPVMLQFEELFKSAGPEKRIYMAFNDPEGSYVKLFDGLRFHIEFPLYVASQNRIHLFPDWLAVIQTNFVGAPDCWGREPKEVIRNLTDWNADFAMIYQVNNDEIENKWQDSGFRIVSTVDGEAYESDKKKISWWLLERPVPKSN
jgi:hypothetical protein